jgi:rhodanese-related sulfurtransferase
MSVEQISAEQLLKLRQENPDLELIDVRTPAEFGELHVAFARNIPLDRLKPAELGESRNGQADQALYVICRTGSRSKMACDKLVAAGFSQIVNVQGGTQSCEQAGLPMVRGAKAMSLERQVRIAAGSLVLLGCVLGFLVHPGFYGLAAFVGAGLVFAGVTDTCAMGMLLARLPWNQASGCKANGQSCGV